MTGHKSDAATVLDAVQAELRTVFKQSGFRVRGRTYNRRTPQDLIQVVNFQMGSFDPPGTTYIPGLRENLHGKFTVNLGIYVPEVAQYHVGGAAKSFINEYQCCIRARLGEVGHERQDLWWPLSASQALNQEIETRLTQDALPFLNRFATREDILREIESGTVGQFIAAPRIIEAIIVAKQGAAEKARELLTAQAKETHVAGHAQYVRGLAERLGLSSLDA
jgi:hypothetical protein